MAVPILSMGVRQRGHRLPQLKHKQIVDQTAILASSKDMEVIGSSSSNNMTSCCHLTLAYAVRVIYLSLESSADRQTDRHHGDLQLSLQYCWKA